FLTLVVVEAAREWEGMTVTADDGTVQEVAQIIGKEVRDTDLLGHTERGTVSVVLLDADFEHSARVIDRLIARIENYEFPAARRPLTTIDSAPATSCGSKSTRTRSCRSRFRSGRTERSRCRWSATSRRRARPRSNCATPPPKRSRST